MEASGEGGLSTLKEGGHGSALEPRRRHLVYVWTSTEPRGSLAFLWGTMATQEERLMREEEGGTDNTPT